MKITVGVGENAATLKYGVFITNVIDFLLMALVIFTLVKILNGVAAKVKKEEEEAPPTEKECPFCKTQIPIAATRCPNCTSELK